MSSDLKSKPTKPLKPRFYLHIDFGIDWIPRSSSSSASASTSRSAVTPSKSHSFFSSRSRKSSRDTADPAPIQRRTRSFDDFYQQPAAAMASAPDFAQPSLLDLNAGGPRTFAYPILPLTPADLHARDPLTGYFAPVESPTNIAAPSLPVPSHANSHTRSLSSEAQRRQEAQQQKKEFMEFYQSQQRNQVAEHQRRAQEARRQQQQQQKQQTPHHMPGLSAEETLAFDAFPHPPISGHRKASSSVSARTYAQAQAQAQAQTTARAGAPGLRSNSAASGSDRLRNYRSHDVLFSPVTPVTPITPMPYTHRPRASVSSIASSTVLVPEPDLVGRSGMVSPMSHMEESFVVSECSTPKAAVARSIDMAAALETPPFRGPTRAHTFSEGGPVEPAMRSPLPCSAAEMMALSSAMVTVDNGFEDQWWHTGPKHEYMRYA